MRFVLVVSRAALFPGLSPQGFLPPGHIDLEAQSPHLFFAERDYVEHCSHFKQVIPYLVLVRRRDGVPRVLAYQRRSDHTEARLGGLWSLGFGGHVEPFDRGDASVAAMGLVRAAAMRELKEETGLSVSPGDLVTAGFINSEREDVSSVHLGVVYLVTVDDLHGDDETLAAAVTAQAEPYRVSWLPLAGLGNMLAPGCAPEGGTFEDWSRIAAREALGQGG